MADKDKELAKKFDDVVTTEKLERINSSVGDLQKAVDDANAKIAAMSVGAGGGSEVKDREYSDAFMAHVHRGDIQASLNKGTDPEGGYLAPIEWDRTITDKLKLVSPMRQIASQTACPWLDGTLTSKPSSPVKLTRIRRSAAPQIVPSPMLMCGNASAEMSSPWTSGVRISRACGPWTAITDHCSVTEVSQTSRSGHSV